MKALFAYFGTLDTLLVILLPSVLVAGTIFFLYARKLASINVSNRREEMRLLAEKINFEYSEGDNIGITERLAREKNFFFSPEGRIENLIYGRKNDISVALFDYTFPTLQKERVTVCSLTLPVNVSTFSMTPLSDDEINSGITAQLGEKLLGEKYRLDCVDKKFAATAFNENLVEFLSRRRRTAVLGNANIMVFHRDKILSVRTCYSLLDFAFGLFTKMDIGGSVFSQEPADDENGESLTFKAERYTD